MGSRFRASSEAGMTFNTPAIVVPSMRSVKPETAGRPYDQIRQVPARATTAILLSVTLVAACQPSSSSSRQTPTPTATAVMTCPARAASPGGQVMLSGLASPDDLAFDAEGRHDPTGRHGRRPAGGGGGRRRGWERLEIQRPLPAAADCQAAHTG